MSPFLPSDCLREIFEHMHEISGSKVVERKLLLTCLLVNRLWCETAVEILWRNPWSLGKFYTDEIYWISLSKTIFLCLSKEQKEYIEKYGINLPSFMTKQRPLLNYVSNIQYLSNEHIKKVVKTLTNWHNLSTSSRYYNANIIENELWKLFMEKCSSVKYLELPSTSIFNFSGADQCLTTLSEFECSTYNPAKLFLDLAIVCRNIKKMIINPCGDDNEGLETLIFLQKNLQEVKLCAIDERDECQRIGEALATKSESLKSIFFEYSICMPITTLSKLTGLKSLKIYIKDIDSNLEDLECVELPGLESLEIINSAYQPLDLYTSIIQNGCSLRKVHFNTFPHPSEEEIQPYIQSLITFCPNIEEITLWYIEEIYDDLDQLLSSCKNLKCISLEALSTFSNLEESLWDDDDDDDDDCQENVDLDYTLACDALSIFDLFVTKNPCNLIQLSLSGSWRFCPLELETFLKSWKGNPLFLKLTCDFEMNDDHYTILNNFQSNGTIKGWSNYHILDSD